MSDIKIRRFIPVIAGYVSIPDRQIEDRNKLRIDDPALQTMGLSYETIGMGDVLEAKLYPADVDSDATPNDIYQDLRDAVN